MFEVELLMFDGDLVKVYGCKLKVVTGSAVVDPFSEVV